MNKPLHTAADVLMVPESSESRKRRIRNQVIDIATTDEAFRREILDVLKAMGVGRRGRVSLPKWQKLKLENAFEMFKFHLKREGKKATNQAVADAMTRSLYEGTDSDTLLKQLRRQRRETKK
ncbi:MAG TPA: hypothetical protein VHB46_04440 [Burkholderiales bacterium]|nr:hypothetical protein [Burkholderiales bacterium]